VYNYIVSVCIFRSKAERKSIYVDFDMQKTRAKREHVNKRMEQDRKKTTTTTRNGHGNIPQLASLFGTALAIRSK
jgi:hypothetical protein